MILWLLKQFQMTFLKFRKKLVVLLLLMQLKLLKLDPPPRHSEFTRELELTFHKGEDPVQDVPLIDIREDLPKGQDPSPSVDAFNKSFGTSYHVELLSVGYEVASIGDGASKILTLWKSPTLINEIGE
jgi:hypothetical protein